MAWYDAPGGKIIHWDPEMQLYNVSRSFLKSRKPQITRVLKNKLVDGELSVIGEKVQLFILASSFFGTVTSA